MKEFIDEVLTEEHRREILREAEENRLVEETARSTPLRPTWFTRRMERFGGWLITKGEGMVKRYKTPAANCTSSSRSYAH